MLPACVERLQAQHTQQQQQPEGMELHAASTCGEAVDRLVQSAICIGKRAERSEGKLTSSFNHSVLLVMTMRLDEYWQMFQSNGTIVCASTATRCLPLECHHQHVNRARCLME